MCNARNVAALANTNIARTATMKIFEDATMTTKPAGDNFTPGPWEIEPKENPRHPLYVMTTEGDRIAKCDGLNLADFGPNQIQAKANAKLIACAPEMLEALYECEAYGSELAKMDSPGVAPDWYATVKAVIEKATT